MCVDFILKKKTDCGIDLQIWIPRGRMLIVYLILNS